MHNDEKNEGKTFLIATHATVVRAFTCFARGFDAAKMAADGLLLRDGCHIKVKDALPLSPYLIFSATWETIGLEKQLSTPAEFSALADEAFSRRFKHAL